MSKFGVSWAHCPKVRVAVLSQARLELNDETVLLRISLGRKNAKATLRDILQLADRVVVVVGKRPDVGGQICADKFRVIIEPAKISAAVGVTVGRSAAGKDDVRERRR